MKFVLKWNEIKLILRIWLWYYFWTHIEWHDSTQVEEWAEAVEVCIHFEIHWNSSYALTLKIVLKRLFCPTETLLMHIHDGKTEPSISVGRLYSTNYVLSLCAVNTETVFLFLKRVWLFVKRSTLKLFYDRWRESLIPSTLMRCFFLFWNSDYDMRNSEVQYGIFQPMQSKYRKYTTLKKFKVWVVCVKWLMYKDSFVLFFSLHYHYHFVRLITKFKQFALYKRKSMLSVESDDDCSNLYFLMLMFQFVYVRRVDRT